MMEIGTIGLLFGMLRFSLLASESRGGAELSLNSALLHPGVLKFELSTETLLSPLGSGRVPSACLLMQGEVGAQWALAAWAWDGLGLAGPRR